jgi:hypothetical protein
MNLIKPPKLNSGDTIAMVSPAWSCASDTNIRWRYYLSVQRCEKDFGLNVKPMLYSLRGMNSQQMVQ